jgi:hypothetical protein
MVTAWYILRAGRVIDRDLIKRGGDLPLISNAGGGKSGSYGQENSKQ